METEHGGWTVCMQNVLCMLICKVYCEMDVQLIHCHRSIEFTPGFSGVRVSRSLVLCVCFVDRFCLFACVINVNDTLD